MLSVAGVFIAFGGLACLIVIPKIIAIEFNDEKDGTGLVIARGAPKAKSSDEASVSQSPSQVCEERDTGRCSELELRQSSSQPASNPMTHKVDSDK